MMNSQKYRYSSGFTLLEVLIALSIISLIMLTVINFTQSTQDTAERVTAEDKELLQIETAMSRLEWDISHIYSPLYFSHKMDPTQMSEGEGVIYNDLIQKYSKNQRFNFISYDALPIPFFQNPEKSEFIFLTQSNRRKFQDIKQSHFAWIRYSLKTDENSETKDGNKMLVRNVLADDIFSDQKIEWDDLKDQVLMRKINKLKFEFWDKKNQKWRDNLDIIEDGKNKALGIRITMEYLGPDNIESIAVRIFRPLFPDFTPENMYKFLNAKPEPAAPPAGSGNQ